MTKKKSVAIIMISILAISCSIFYVSAVNPQTDLEMDKKNAVQISEQDSPEEMQNALLEAQEIDKVFNERKAKEDANDIKVKKILENYFKQDVTVLTKDKAEDFKTMALIVTMLKEANLSKADEEISKKYLERRYPYIDDEILKNSVGEVLKK